MDDVHHLLKAAREESYLFVVDSRMRDTAVYPSPSEYEISFSSPFRNVFGLDLVDASVARTEYIVESNTNTLEYIMSVPVALSGPAGSAWNQGQWVTAAAGKRTITLDPGDYNLPQFIDHLNSKFEAAAAASGEAPIRCAALTNPSEISNRISFSCQAPFTFLMSTSTVRHTLGFGDPVSAAAAAQGMYRTVPGWSVNLTGGASDVFLSSEAGALPEVSDANPTPATLGPLPAGDGADFEAVHTTRVLRQYFVALTGGPPTSVLAYVYAMSGGGTPPDLAVRVARASDGETLAIGTLSAIPDDPNSAYVAAQCTLASAAGQQRVLVAGQQYFVEFAAAGGGGSEASFVGVYYNADNLPVSADRYITLDGAMVHDGQNLSVDVVCSSFGYSMISPGVVNLTGPRYINIRCPDVESHMFRDRVNESVHVGLGMLKLSGYGFREQRFDFVNFPPRRFHPIGRLTKLRFRLERPDGSLYDSHGVDHTLLLVVRYYSMPSGDEDPETAAARSSRLNPDYVPDLRRHLIQHHWRGEASALDMDRVSKRY